jgi:hypothetical protein
MDFVSRKYSYTFTFAKVQLLVSVRVRLTPPTKWLTASQKSFPVTSASNQPISAILTSLKTKFYLQSQSRVSKKLK